MPSLRPTLAPHHCQLPASAASSTCRESANGQTRVPFSRLGTLFFLLASLTLLLCVSFPKHHHFRLLATLQQAFARDNSLSFFHSFLSWAWAPSQLPSYRTYSQNLGKRSRFCFCFFSLVFFCPLPLILSSPLHSITKHQPVVKSPTIRQISHNPPSCSLASSSSSYLASLHLRFLVAAVTLLDLDLLIVWTEILGQGEGCYLLSPSCILGTLHVMFYCHRIIALKKI